MLPFRYTFIAFALSGAIGVTAAFAEGTPAAPQSGPVAAQQAQLPDSIKPSQIPKPNANPLNLNPAQQKALADLRKEQTQNMQAINALQRELMELNYSDSYDDGKAEELIEKIAKATEDNLTGHTKKANAFYVSLSPEQKRQFKAFEQRRANMIERQMGLGRPAAPPPAKPPVQKAP